jgi:hypothetical protein
MKIYVAFHVKYSLFLSDFNESWTSSIDLPKNITPTANLIKIRPVGAELFRTDGQTDRHDEANSRFSQFCERTQQIDAVWENNLSLFALT